MTERGMAGGDRSTGDYFGGKHGGGEVETENKYITTFHL